MPETNYASTSNLHKQNETSRILERPDPDRHHTPPAYPLRIIPTPADECSGINRCSVRRNRQVLRVVRMKQGIIDWHILILTLLTLGVLALGIGSLARGAEKTPESLIKQGEETITKVGADIQKTPEGYEGFEEIPITSSGDIDWKQEPTKYYKPADQNVLDMQQRIVKIAQEENFPSLLALSLSYIESWPKFHHYDASGNVIDSGTGSKGVFQVTHTTAYGYSAPSNYRGKGSLCKADYSGKGTGPCRGMDFCQPEGNIRCAIRIFREKQRITADDTMYEIYVEQNCKDQAVVNRYLTYKGDTVKKALRAYNHLGCDGEGPAAEDYVEKVLGAARQFVTVPVS